jgi:hypothetical protein
MRYYRRNTELDLDVERAALRVALLSNRTLLPIYPYLPNYSYYNPLPSYAYYGIPPAALPYYNGYPYSPSYPYLYY